EKGHGASEYRYMHKDGTYRWIREEFKLVRDADGNPYELVGYEIDITERKRAEEEMISAKSRLEFLLGSSPAIIYSSETSGDFQLKFISENVYSILGYTAEECLADPEFASYAYLHPDDKERVMLEFQDPEGKDHGVSEYRFPHKDGTYRWIREEYKLVRDADGNPLEYVGYEIDITERKRAEEELVSAKSRLEYLLGSSPAIIYTCEASGDFLLKSVSENVFSILGYPVEECLTDPEFFEDTYVHPDDRERLDSDFEDAVAKGGGTSEYRFLHKNGTYRWMRDEFKLVRDADGNPYEFVGYWIDITQRKWAEEALVESEERFRSVFESSMIGMYRTTPDGRVLMANPAFARMLGYDSVGEIVQHNLEKDGYWAEYERSLFRERLEKEGQITGLEASWTRKDGTSLYVRESAFAVYDKAGRAVYYEGTVEDITERKRAEARLQDSEEKYHNLFRRSNHGIFIHDMDGNIMDVNRKVLDMFGYSKSEILAFRIPDLHPPEAQEASRRAFQKISRDGHANFEIDFKRKNGEIFPAEVASGFFEVAGQKVVQGIVRDITRRKRAEEALRDSEASFRLLFADNPHPMWVYDLETLRFLEVNDAAVEHYGYSRDEFLNMRVTDIRPPEEARRLLESMQEPRSPLRHGGQMKHRLKNSLLIDVEVVSHTLEFDGRKAALVVAQDITERKQAEEQLVHNALHDSLTDLPNRLLLADRMEQMLARSKRRKDYSFAVLFLDLDRFKVVNDSLGHTVGDELLVGVARRLEKCLRSGDTVARVGGDEFTMLLDDIEGPSDATQAAERIQEELAPPFILSERQVFTTASIGIAFSAAGYDRSEDILRDADTAMYRAKELGRARHKVFDETMHTRAVDTFQLQTDLRRAVERNEFLIQYQPIVSLESGKLVGLEALLRWQHPQRGVIPPKEFIYIAEETGFINTIGLWVIQESGRRLRAWQEQFPKNASLFLSINISGKLFIQPDMVPQIGEILQEIDLCPSNLRLEVTEGAVMENTQSATETLSRLKALRVRFHLDDFGTGYSSLSYLHRFPFDGLKIDQSFIDHLSATDGSLDIVRTIVTLARTLHMETIAEGVETAEQLAHLKAIKCQYAQGFLFSKPLDSSAVGPFLESDPQYAVDKDGELL
ncbi:MAG: PAS domain S-box protein, partial [Acidobacteriota bacterium]